MKIATSNVALLLTVSSVYGFVPSILRSAETTTTRSLESVRAISGSQMPKDDDEPFDCYFTHEVHMDDDNMRAHQQFLPTFIFIY